MDTITPDWTSLPGELLTSIAKRLHTKIDILRFRAVCRSFRCILPHPPKFLFPESILKTTDFLKGPNPDSEDPFVLIESTVYVIQPLDDETSAPWLVEVEETTSGKFQIKDPLSELYLKNLPQKSLNLLDYRVKEISKSYMFELASTDEGNERDSSDSFVAAEVVPSSFIDQNDDGFVVMAKFGDQLSVWRNIDKKWTDIDTAEIEIPDYPVDIVYRNHKFYTISYVDSAIIVDSKSLNVVEVAFPVDLAGWFDIYLLESSNDLLMIAWNGTDKKLLVFKLDEEKCQWIQVTDGLEDRVFFVGLRSSYSVVADDFCGCKGSHVYIKVVDEDDTELDVKTFNLKDNSVEEIDDNPFWPPPPWVFGDLENEFKLINTT
ncbi:F-box protein SKIP23-like [Mangifera indica]|uniref:F-box protein SKIP23-like n=1 Tax=Mangifera indica TaxID=29780 RepID=UPI001CF99ABD|nr:F-box protein SKIP23-like [Mangifera indica]